MFRSVAAVLTAALVAPAALAGAAAPALEWTVSRDLAGEGDGGLITVGDGAGGVFLVAATPLFSGAGEDVVVARYDGGGVELWMTTYTGVGPGTFEYPADAALGDGGDLFVTCQSSLPSGAITQEWATLRIDADSGAILWEARHFGPGTFGSAYPRDLAIGPEGEVVVAGWTRDDATWTDFGVVSYAPDGTELWEGSFSSPGFQADSGEAVAVGPDGCVVVAGQYVAPGGRIIATAKWNAAGVLQWSDTFDATAVASLDDNVRSVAIDDDGGIYVAGDGIDDFTNGRDFVLLRYAPDGTREWDRRVVGPESDIWPMLRLGPEGRVYLSGTSSPDHRVVAFDSAGNQLWIRDFDGAVADDAQRDHVAVDASGRLAVLLRTVFTPGITAFTVLRYDPDGTLADATTIDPQGRSRFPAGLAADGLGNLFAIGNWIPSGDRDILLYKLAAPAPPAGDATGDAIVDVDDLVAVITAWGVCPADEACPADVNGSGTVDVDDMVMVIVNWS